MTAAVPTTSNLAQVQASGGGQLKASIKSKAVAYKLVHDDMLAITDAAHSLVILGTAGLDGKFHLPRNHGAQDTLNTARAFKTDAAAFSTDYLGWPVSQPKLGLMGLAGLQLLRIS